MKKNDKKIIAGVVAIGVVLVLALMIILWPKGGDPSLENSSGSTSSTQGTESSGTVTDPTQSTGETEPGVTDPTESHPTASDPADSTDPTDPQPTEPPVTDSDPTEHSHSYTSAATAATCTAGGYTTYTCSCGHSYRGNETAALGHSYTSTVVQPTYTAQGYTQHTCSRCGSSYKDSYTPVLEQEEPDAPLGVLTAPYTGPLSTSSEFYADLWDSYDWDVVDAEAKADINTGISWDGKSPIIYTYPDGTTGTELRPGAMYEYQPAFILTIGDIPELDMDWENYGKCIYCGRTTGEDGADGKCVRWLAGSVHTCSACGETVPTKTCHTCKEDEE